MIWGIGPKAEASRGYRDMLPRKILKIRSFRNAIASFMRGNCKMFNCLKSLEFCAQIFIFEVHIGQQQPAQKTSARNEYQLFQAAVGFCLLLKLI